MHSHIKKHTIMYMFMVKHVQTDYVKKALMHCSKRFINFFVTATSSLLLKQHMI